MRIKKIFEILNRTPSLKDGAEISLKDALEYGKDEKNQKYFFSPEERKGKTVFIVHINEPEKEEKEEQSVTTLENSKPKTKRNSSFINDITGNGAYQGIDRKVMQNRIDRGQPRKYGDWQKAKKYNPNQFIRGERD